LQVSPDGKKLVEVPIKPAESQSPAPAAITASSSKFFVQVGAFAQEGRGGPKDSDAAKAYYQRAVALGDEDAKKALERLRCPYTIKDKRGNVVTNLCF